MLRRHLLSTGAVLALGGLLPTTIRVAEAKPAKKGLLAKNASGTWTGASNATGTLTSDVLIQKLKLNPRTRTLLVQGLITSTGGNVTPFANQPFTARAKLTEAGGAGAKQVCQVLNLDIGPINLNLLGLVVDIAPISIDVTAIPGGGLLGDLLCSLAGLLSGGGPLGQIQRLLGQINQILSSVLLILGGGA